MTTNKQQEELQKLFVKGQLVQVHVSKWGMCASLEQSDLKINKELPELFRLGKKWLIPDGIRNKITRIEGQARTYLKRNSFKFPVADAHFVPFKTLIPVINELTKFREEFTTQVNEFLNNYGQYQKEVLDSNTDYRDVLEGCYPPVESIRSKFAFSIERFEISLPEKLKDVSLEKIAAEVTLTDAEKTRITSQLEYDRKLATERMNSFVGECVQALRTKVIEASNHVAEKIARGDLISRTNINTLDDVTQNFLALNFFNDKDVEAQINNLRSLVTSNRDFKRKDAIKELGTALSTLTTEISKVADARTLTGEFFRNIEL